MITTLIILVVIISAVLEFIDSTLGMGYGTTLTPILMLMGFSPLQIVPAILISELFSGISAAYLHHRAGNVFFDFRKDKESSIAKRLGKLGYIPASRAAKVAFALSICSAIGAVIAVLIAVNIPQFALKMYIGILVLTMGIIILLRHKKSVKFSWKKIFGLGTIASFNKGISGGGYGPVVASGQILSGVDSKEAISITSFAEAVTCLVGIVVYFAVGTKIDWQLAPALIVGAMMSVPLSAYTVKRIKTEKLTLTVGIATLALGIFTIIKILI